LLIDLIKKEGCDRISQQIKDELEASKRLHWYNLLFKLIYN
jgi:hypothetical protein